MEDTERIAIKVRKLLALATSSNPHEAALAAEKAQELLQKYNLDLFTVQAEPPKYDKTVVYLDNGAMWRHALLHGICKANNASVIRTTRIADNAFSIIAEKSAVEIIGYMYSYLADEIDRLADQAWDENPSPWESAKGWKGAFRTGAVATIVRRLKEQRAQFANASESRALVVVQDKVLAETVRQYFPRRTGRSSSSGYTSSSGRAAGERAGEGIGIRAGVRAPGGNTSGLLGRGE